MPENTIIDADSSGEYFDTGPEISKLAKLEVAAEEGTLIKVFKYKKRNDAVPGSLVDLEDI